MKFNKILITGFEKSELSFEVLKKLDVLCKKKIFYPESGSDILKHRADADCLVVKFNAVTKADINCSPNLKYIGVMSTGYGKVDIGYAKSKGIVVTNIPGYSTESVAEFVFAVTLEKIREIEKGKKQARKGNYSEDDFTATEIKDKTFGILGLGRIGQRVAELASCFGANVIYWSKQRKRDFEKKGIKYENLYSLIPKCDILSLHLALTKDTENILNNKMFNKIKKGAIVINTAPMVLVDINALEKRLKAKDITFILDHLDEMTELDLKKLSKYNNCIIYPPIAYISKEAGEAKQGILVENMTNFLKGSSSNVVS